MVARWLRHLPDRLRHSARKRATEGEVLKSRAVRRIVVVCHGNICRSPYAERVLRHRLRASGRGDILVSSAGFIGPDRPAPATACDAAAARGIDLAGHRSRLLAPEDLTMDTLVLVMNAEQHQEVRRLGHDQPVLVQLGDLDPEPIDRRAIADPFDQPRVVFDQVYERIDRCVARLAALLPPGAASV